MTNDLASVKEMLYNKLKMTTRTANEVPPDWLNPHDFHSGYYKGYREYAKLTSEMLQDIIDALEKEEV